MAFWELVLTAINPKGDLPPILVYPCSKPFDQQANTRCELAELLNRMKQHIKCSTAYYYYKIEETGEMQCKFYFPKPLQPSSTMSNLLNPK